MENYQTMKAEIYTDKCLSVAQQFSSIKWSKARQLKAAQMNVAHCVQILAKAKHGWHIM